MTKRKHNSPWLPMDVARMRRFAREGKSAKQFAQASGRTLGAVKFKAMAEGVRFHAINQPKGVQKKLAVKRRRTGDMTVTLRRRAA